MGRPAGEVAGIGDVEEFRSDGLETGIDHRFADEQGCPGSAVKENRKGDIVS